MKKILILLCAILWGIGAEAQRLRSADTTTDDLKQLLAEAGYQTHAFDLTDFLSKTYHVQLQIREGEFTPLLFYGSYWFDARANRFRFCGEKQIAPNLSSEIVERVPHFFVIGVQMTPME